MIPRTATLILPPGVDDLLKKFESRITALEQALLLVSKRTNVDISKVLELDLDTNNGSRKSSDSTLLPPSSSAAPQVLPKRTTVVFSAKKLWINIRSLTEQAKNVATSPQKPPTTSILSSSEVSVINDKADDTPAESLPVQLRLSMRKRKPTFKAVTQDKTEPNVQKPTTTHSTPSSSSLLSQQPEPEAATSQSEEEEGYHNQDDNDNDEDEEYFPNLSDIELEDEDPLKVCDEDNQEKESKDQPADLLKCLKCDLTFPDNHQLTLHNEVKHRRGRKSLSRTDEAPSSGKPKEYKCDKCFLGGFPTVKALNLHKTKEHRIHAKVRNGQGWRSCPHCDYKVYGNTKYQIHLRVHTGERPYLCSQCGFAAKCRATLKVHTKRMHDGDIKTLVCKYCGKEVKGNNNLKIHEKLHEGYGQMCTICNRKFVNLRGHIQTVHERLRKYECHLCEFKFLKKSNLDRHVKTHANPNRRIKSYHVVRPERLLNRGTKTVLRIFDEEVDQNTKIQEEAVLPSTTTVEAEEDIQGDNDGNKVLEAEGGVLVVLENSEEALSFQEES